MYIPNATVVLGHPTCRALENTVVPSTVLLSDASARHGGQQLAATEVVTVTAVTAGLTAKAVTTR